MILFFGLWASPHQPTLDLVVGGLAQGLARGLPRLRKSPSAW